MQSQNARIEENGNASRLIDHPTLLARMHSLHSTRPAAHSSCWPQSHLSSRVWLAVRSKVQDILTCADLHHFLINLPVRTLFRLANPLQREAWKLPPLPAP